MIERLSHLLLQVRDLSAAEAFYIGVLGCTVRERTTLRDGRPLVALHQGLGLTVFPDQPGPPTVDHIAFRVRSLDPLLERLQVAGVAVEGPVRTATYGTSIYVRDPDGNRVELHDGGA